MLPSKCQFILYSNIPVLDFMDTETTVEERIELFSFTDEFIELLSIIESQSQHLKVYLALPPVYYEVLESLEFQHQMTEYYEKMSCTSNINYWLKWEGRLLHAIRELIKKGKVELLAAPMTFALLPYITTSHGQKLQIRRAVSLLERYFSIRPKGFWFPNGSFSPGLDLAVVSEGLLFSFIESSTILYADPTPVGKGKLPVLSPHCLTFHPIDLVISPQNIDYSDEDNQLCMEWGKGQELKTICVDFRIDKNHLRDIFHQLEEQLSKACLKMLSHEDILMGLEGPLEQVHLCSTSINNHNSKLIFGRDIIPQWSECYFIEKDLENMKDLISDKNELFEQLNKEWMLLAGYLSNQMKDNPERINMHIEKYKKKRSKVFDHQSNQFLLNQKSSNRSRKKVLMLSWEYPPNVVGGLARHVYGLATSLSKLDYEIHLITSRVEGLKDYEEDEGVIIHRVNPLNEKDPDFLSWIAGLNLAMLKKANELSVIHNFTLIHAHDWLVGSVGLHLKESLQIPLVTTIHATEHGRNQGIHTEIQNNVHEKERTLVLHSDYIITCSQYMKEEVQKIFQFDEKKVAIIPNGVEKMTRGGSSYSQIISKFPIFPERKMIFSIGRMVKEKGFDTLIEAAAIMKDSNPDLYFIIAGKGPMLEEYRQMVKDSGLEKKVYFVGQISDEERNALLHRCDIAVFPSIYEPFGIVALEAMSARKPTIVSAVGGLKGIVQHRKSGLLMESRNAHSFIEQADFLLSNKREADEIGKNGQETIEKFFSWTNIAIQTSKVFDEILSNSNC